MFMVDKFLGRQLGEERRYATLLWSLVFLFAAYPIATNLGLSRFWSFLLVAELLLAVYSVTDGRRSLYIALALVTPAILGEVSFFVFESRETHWFSVISVGTFLSYVIFVVYRQSVFGGGRVTTDRTAGAISVYLLLGLLWSLAYGVISAADPEAFKGLGPFSLDEPGAQQDFIYFSFVTLTTLGYGDMSPVAPLAKTLAWFEAVVGQLFLAVTIARLVSLEISHKENPPDDA